MGDLAADGRALTNPDGALAWDTSVAIGDMLSRKIRPRVASSVANGRVALIYAFKGRITRRVFEGGVEVDQAARARVAFDDGAVVTGRDESSEHW